LSDPALKHASERTTSVSARYKGVDLCRKNSKLRARCHHPPS